MSGFRALVLADGPAGTRAELDVAWPGWEDRIRFVVAADGGARHAADLGLPVHAWVGDGDSLGPATREWLLRRSVPVDPASTDKDESDAELAVVAAAMAGATDITILGAIGGPRLDHALANVWLLAHPVLAGRSARLLDPAARVRILDGTGRQQLDGRIGDLVTLLAFDGPVRGVTTTGLRYPLVDADLIAGPARGLSNVRVTADAAITLRSGRILVVESPATLRR